MPEDRYSTFTDLFSNETEGKDYRIVVENRGTSDLIMAPHGGRIEPGTSRVASLIAGDDKSLYLFEGLRHPLAHHELHVTSHKYDEPRALEIAGASERVIAIHGRADGEDASSVWLGGLDVKTARIIALGLKEIGLEASFPDGPLSGKHSRNICNRSRSSGGVQLELPRSLRNQFLQHEDLVIRFSAATRAALSNSA